MIYKEIQKTKLINKQGGFIQLIKTITDLPIEPKERLRAFFPAKNINEGEYFVHADRISRPIAFVKSELYRCFYTTESAVEFI